MYKFDATNLKLIWVEDAEYISEPGILDLGAGDLIVDTGSREVDSSTIDQGLR